MGVKSLAACCTGMQNLAIDRNMHTGQTAALSATPVLWPECVIAGGMWHAWAVQVERLNGRSQGNRGYGSNEWPIPGKKCSPSPIIAINAKKAVKAQTKLVRAIFNFMPLMIVNYQSLRQDGFMLPPL